MTGECAYIFSKWKTRFQGILFFSCVATLVNSVGYFFETIAGSFDAYYIALCMSYLGRIWVPFTLFLFTVYLCKIKVHKYVQPFLAVIHFVTYIFVITSRYHEWYYTDMVFVEEGVFPHINNGHGPWYIFYSILIFGYMIYGIPKLVKAAIREKCSIAKKRLWCVNTSIFVICFFYSLCFTDIFGCFDPTIIGYTLGALILCYAFFKYALMDNLEVARDYIIDEVSEAFIVSSKQGQMEYMNKGAVTLSRFYPTELEFFKAIENISSREENLVLEDRVYSVTKENLNHKNTEAGFVYVIKDDTEHFRYLQELKEQKEVAEAANASKSAFLSIVSHEIRTPMNAVVGMTDLILRDGDNLNDRQLKYLHSIKKSGDALVMIVNDILDQSKIEAGKMELVEEKYELRSVLEDVKLIIEERIGEKPIEFVLDVSEEVPQYLIGDSLRIRQILINLCNNAVKFTEKGFIRLSISPVVEVEADKLSLRFGIRDSGQGIKPEDLSKLGQAFSQVDTKKNHGKEGTGLGLSISKDFIEMMGGKLEVTSEYLKGTEFFFTIKQGVSTESEQMEIFDEADQEFVCPNVKLMVVDDTEINLMIFEEMITPIGASVTCASSGEQALKYLENESYDVIFMDYVMPFMDGVETTRNIREMGVSTPVIALSSDDSEDTNKRFLEAGVTGFTSKPVSLKNVKKLVCQYAMEKIEK